MAATMIMEITTEAIIAANTKVLVPVAEEHPPVVPLLEAPPREVHLLEAAIPAAVKTAPSRNRPAKRLVHKGDLK
jgi:hypothetical protein